MGYTVKVCWKNGRRRSKRRNMRRKSRRRSRKRGSRRRESQVSLTKPDLKTSFLVGAVVSALGAQWG